MNRVDQPVVCRDGRRGGCTCQRRVDPLTPFRHAHFYLCSIALVLFPAAADAAAPTFPRGPGYYFHLGKLLFAALLYFAWARTAWWVDQDSRNLDLATPTW